MPVQVNASAARVSSRWDFTWRLSGKTEFNQTEQSKKMINILLILSVSYLESEPTNRYLICKWIALLSRVTDKDIYHPNETESRW